MLCLCSVQHYFRHTTEMLLIIPDVKSIASTILSASIHTDMSRLRFRCFIYMGMPPVVTGSPWLVAQRGPLGRCPPRGTRQPCGRLPGSQHVVAQNNIVIMDGRPGRKYVCACHLPDMHRFTWRRALVYFVRQRNKLHTKMRSRKPNTLP